MNALVAGVHYATVTEWIRQHALRACGAERQQMPEVQAMATLKLDPPGLAECLTVPEPEDLRRYRRARLVVGTMRYNHGGAGSCSGRYFGPCIESAIARWHEYERTGNREHLVDIANLVAIEWLWPNRETHDRSRVCQSRDVGARLNVYLNIGTRCCLAAAIDAVRREWSNPTHPNAHWHAADTGGHWSLRNISP